VDISFTVLCVFVCTVTDFSDEDKACSVKFCQAVHRRPRQGISHFGELSSHRSPEPDESASAPPSPRRSQRLPFGARTHACAVREIVRRVVVASACADIRQSPKTDVLVKYFTHTHTHTHTKGIPFASLLHSFTGIPRVVNRDFQFFTNPSASNMPFSQPSSNMSLHVDIRKILAKKTEFN